MGQIVRSRSQDKNEYDQSIPTPTHITNHSPQKRIYEPSSLLQM